MNVGRLIFDLVTRVFPEREGKFLYIRKGRIIVKEGDEPGFAYIIEKGRALVSKGTGTGKRIEVKILGEKDIIGELSLIDGLPCAATVTALEDCKLVRLITPKRFNILYQDHPDALFPMFKILSKRLRGALGLLKDSKYKI